MSGLSSNGSTDETSALNNSLAQGDVNLPAGTYLISGTIDMPSDRTIQCQPGATLQLNGTISFSGSSESTIIGCTLIGSGSNTAITISGGQYNNIIGNVFSNFGSSALNLTNSTTLDVIMLNDFEGTSNYQLSSATHTYPRLNRVGGALTPAIPYLGSISGGTVLQQDTWRVLDDLQGSQQSDGYVDVAPGSTFGGSTCNGNGSGDDTACINSALSSGSILVEPGTYNINGEVRPPAGSNIVCKPGAIFYDTATSNGRMIDIGYDNTTKGNNMIIGCEMRGSYPPSENVSGRCPNCYSELTAVGQNSPVDVLFFGDDYGEAHGDLLLTYSNCGTAFTNYCGGQTPQNSGPNDVTVLMSYFHGPSDQGIVHLNGGHGLHVIFDKLVDDFADNEQDSNVMQIIGSNWAHDVFTSYQGAWDTGNGQMDPYFTCTGHGGIGANNSECYMNDNQIVGGNSSYPANIYILTNGSGCGNYMSNSLTDGAVNVGGGC